MEKAADHGSAAHQTKKSQQAAVGPSFHGSDGGAGNSKPRVDLYAGAVAQRALFGPSGRCRGAARKGAAGNGSKDSKQPSRLSKMSGAEGT
ncbi:hypothetical protein GUJ93_ZPchr0008g13928 [Zizania palustris]|uniref:Uncharacterized protein n=1 Tax=Zizania palustris TaxID=103762 RepID=A0A8J5V0U0_ZIZPA|nr:hypothetical protein GUJ93_ZPchr0008g13928 [Zizania palustris]